MYAISVCQPFATLIVCGLKQYETRGWTTGHRGRLAIHASRSDYGRITLPEEVIQRLKAFGYDDLNALPRGAVVGEVTLVDAIPAENLWDSLTDFERSVGDFSVGRFGWRMAEAARYAQPIDARGQLGLWKWDRDFVNPAYKAGGFRKRTEVLMDN